MKHDSLAVLYLGVPHFTGWKVKGTSTGQADAPDASSNENTKCIYKIVSEKECQP